MLRLLIVFGLIAVMELFILVFTGPIIFLLTLPLIVSLIFKIYQTETM